MANFLELLANLLGGGQQSGNMLASAGRPALRLGGEDTPAGGGNLSPYMAPSAPQAAVQAGPAPMAAPTQAGPAPAQAPSGGGVGGFLQNLFGGNRQLPGENETVSWLQSKGYDENAARYIANDKRLLQQTLVKSMQPAEPDEYNQRATAALKLGLKQGTPEFMNFVAGRDIIKDEKADSWINVGDGRVFNQRTGEFRSAPESQGGGGIFTGNSVEAQALNGLVSSGALTKDQALQLAAGKMVTNPADGSMIFMTPQGIFGKDASGNISPVQAPQPVQPAQVPQVQVPEPSQAPVPQQTAQPTAPSPVVQPTQPTGPGKKPLPPGQMQLTPGKPGKLATEAETRARALYTVASPEMKIVEEMFPALENVSDQVVDKLPWNAGNWATSENYQRGKRALMSIVQTYMYVTSGASAPDKEVERNAEALMPQIGEKPQTVKDKLARIRNYVKAIKQAGGETSSSPADGNDNDPLGIRQ